MPVDPAVIDPGGTPLPAVGAARAALPLVGQDEAGVPMSQWSRTRVSEARRPDGSTVFVKALHVVAGLEADDSTQQQPPVAATEAPVPAAETAADAGDIAVSEAESVEVIAATSIPAEESTPTAVQEPVLAHDWRHPGSVTVPSGARARARANIAAIEVVAACTDSGRPATAAEQEILAGWSGWGAVPEIFDERREEWQADRERLRALLSAQQWAAARQSTLNAHYTDPAVATAMWSVLTQAGFTGGLVLEPGCGSGNFVTSAPDGAQMVGVELDELTGQIAHLLSPSAQIRLEGFEKTRVPENSFDAAIGNVPFGRFSVHDPAHNPRGHSIHNHFICKALALTKPGGYVAMITSSWTMDAENESARRDMLAVADLVGAVRLPSTAFQRVAGTKVVTDVLVFRKREPGRAAPTAEDAGWVSTRPVPMASVDGTESAEISVNTWFDDRPDAVLGTATLGSGLYGPGMVVVEDAAAALLGERVAAVLGSDVEAARRRGLGFDAALYDVEAEYTMTAGASTAATLYAGGKPIGRLDYDGERGEFGRQVGQGRSEAVRVPATRATETRHLLRLRDVAEATITAQRRQRPAGEREALRADLNRIYDAYVAEYGPINRFQLHGGRERTPEDAVKRLAELEVKWRVDHGVDGDPYVGELPAEVEEELTEKAWVARAAVRRQTHLDALRQDPSKSVLLALEVVDDETGQVSKPAIFARDIAVPPAPLTRADSATEAVAVSIAESGRIDLDRVAGLLGTDLAGVREQLRGAAFVDIDNPTGDLLPAALALSGNVRRRLADVEAALVDDPSNRDLLELRDALGPVQPRDKTPSEIGTVKLGPTWITTADYELFARETFGVTDVLVERAAGKWRVTCPGWDQQRAPANLTEYGAPNADDRKDLSAIDLMAALMSQSKIEVRNSAAAVKEGAPEVDTQATALAQVQSRKIAERFAEWVWEDQERAVRLIGEWNRRFNALVAPRHDGSAMQLPGLSSAFDPFPYQRNAVARICAEPTVLLDHVVGAGKTGTMFMAAVELRRRGLVHQPWIVVPTHLIEQVGREAKQWYPAANVLLGSTGMSAQERRTFVAQTATSDWDMVVIPSSVFTLITVTDARRAAFIGARLQEMRTELDKSRDTLSTGSVKAIERAIASERKRLEKLQERKTDAGAVTFEDSGCDYLFVDEAHEYKNRGRTSSIESLSHTGVKKAEDLALKLEVLRERRQHDAHARGVVVRPGAERVATFATGTPIANSLAEAWVMQSYLRPDILADAGVLAIDDWAASFTMSRSETVTNATGTKLRVVSRVSAFSNPREMFIMSGAFTDVVVREQVPRKLPTFGQRAIITSTPGQERRDFIADLDWRADHLDPRRPDLDNVLKVLNDGRNVALDPSLANIGPDPGNTRADAVAAQAFRIWEATRENVYLTPSGEVSPIRGGLQLVFCDRGTPKDDGSASVYSELKDRLVELGVPAEQIGFIHDAKSPTDKAQLQAACRAGRLAVLIGSTPKMGTGMNVQARMVAEHHMDVPWRPADLEQREGRIIRQGNQNDEVEILTYVTAGTTDTVMWGKVESKAAFIQQAKTGQLDGITEVEDIEESDLTEAAAATKAAATGDPRFLRLARLEADIKELAALEGAHRDNTRDARWRVSQADKAIPVMESRIEVLTELVTDHERWRETGKPFTVAGHPPAAKRVDRSEQLLARAQANVALLKKSPTGYRRALATFPNGVEAYTILSLDQLGVVLDCPGQPARYIELKKLWTSSAEQARLDDHESRSSARAAIAGGLATRLENLFDDLPLEIGRLHSEIDKQRAVVAAYAGKVGQVFSRSEELTAMRVEMSELRLAIAEHQKSAEAVAAQAAAAQRLARAGRQPGWTLQLNPTPAMADEVGLSKAEFVAAARRLHRTRAAEYARTHPEQGGVAVGDLLRAASLTDRPAGAVAQPPDIAPPATPVRDPDRGYSLE